ncbi:hypothetical protein [uncultured Lutibacter sp.]|uniref:hypothetical protein n=1 Tax=uncultured Lutibacter sp. TaxID=437739 RepID=UPI00263631C5|nr:hypothetical protein [uncultured Lutibacter sp.]
MAYSLKIHDPAFKQHIKNTKNYRYQFGFGLAIVAVAGFYLYGETSSEMDNPEALYIGLGIGGMFFLIGIYAMLSVKKTPSWDGEVVEKEIIEKGKSTDFVVYIADQRNKKHEIRSENDATIYNYYKVGEKVRFHGELQSYEKFDKSKDDIIFCNACSFMHEIDEHICRNCGCPLLK